MPAADRNPRLTLGSPAVYRIAVAGALDPTHSDRLAGMRIESAEGGGGDRERVTILIGLLADQAQLAGVMNTLFEWRLPILSVEMLSEDSSEFVQVEIDAGGTK